MEGGRVDWLPLLASTTTTLLPLLASTTTTTTTDKGAGIDFAPAASVQMFDHTSARNVEDRTGNGNN